MVEDGGSFEQINRSRPRGLALSDGENVQESCATLGLLTIQCVLGASMVYLDAGTCGDLLRL